MQNKMRRFVALLLTLFAVVRPICADNDISVTASAPRQVAENQRFQLTFTVNNAQPDSFRLSKMKHIKLLSGPTRSSSSSTQIIGGRMLYSATISLNYVAMADKKGDFVIPGAAIWIKGKKYISNELEIKVVGAESNGDNSSQQQKNRQQERGNSKSLSEAAADEVSGEDVFVKTEWENGDVYAGGDNALLIKLYYRVSVAGWNNLQLPKFKNCEVSDGEISRNTRYGTAQVNGISYNTVVIIKKIIKPGKEGKLSIGSGDLDIVVNVPNKNDFWGGYHQVNKHLVIPGSVVKVRPESERPIEPSSKNPEQHWNL